MIYICSFASSLLLAYQAKHSKSKNGVILFSILSVSIMALLAGLRGITIGIDTANYYNSSWTSVQFGSTLSDFIRIYLINSRGSLPEIFFRLINRIIYTVTGSFNVFLFFWHFVIVSGIFIGAFRMKKYADPLLTLALFYLFYFGNSLTLIRQYAAMAILFAFAADIEEGKTLRYLVGLIFAMLIHSASILGIIPLVYYTALYRSATIRKYSFIKRFGICILIGMAFLNVVPLVLSLVNIGIIDRRFLWYITSAESANKTSIVDLLFIALELVAILVLWKKLANFNERFDFYFICSFTFALLSLLGFVIHYGDRIAKYFCFLNLITIGSFEGCHYLRNNRIIIKAMIIFSALVYWGYVYLFRNASNILPYYVQIY